MAAREENEWVDGFLFVANRLVLDFLNTKPVLAEGPVELLTDAHALERWMIAAGMVRPAKTKALMKGWRTTREAAAFVAELVGFRERLRSAVLRMEKGLLPTDAFVAEVNALLAAHPQKTALHKRGEGLRREILFEPSRPSDLWMPIAEAAAELLAETETGRLRMCESCVVHFFDTSKKGSRRWCSMEICGNKLKVAAYQKRKREREAATD